MYSKIRATERAKEKEREREKLKVKLIYCFGNLKSH